MTTRHEHPLPDPLYRRDSRPKYVKPPGRVPMSKPEPRPASDQIESGGKRQVRNAVWMKGACIAIAAVVLIGGIVAALWMSAGENKSQHEVFKPVEERLPITNVLAEQVAVLREEEQRLLKLRPQFEERRSAAWLSFRECAGDDHGNLLDAGEQGIAMYFARYESDGTPQKLHATEAARYARLARSADERLLTVRQCRLEAESFLRYVADVNHLNEGGNDAIEGEMIRIMARTKAIGEESALDWDESPVINLSPADIAEEIMPYLRREQEERLRRERELAAAQVEQRRREAEEQQHRDEGRRRRDAEQARQEEAIRLADLAMKQRQAELELEREALEARAQDEARALKLYGKACHIFFQGGNDAVIATLDEAIGLDDGDPRMFYFRGLAKRRLGRSDEAAADFQRGGELERSGAFAVGVALERIQGPERLVVEEYR